MKCRILLHRSSIKRIAILESEHRLVFRAVVFVDPANILHQRQPPNEEQEECEPDNAIHQIEHDLAAQRRVVLLQFSRGQQGKILIHEDEEADREDDVRSSNPAADLKFLLFLAFDFRFRLPNSSQH